MKLSRLAHFLNPSSKNQKKSSLKKFIYFQEMKLSTIIFMIFCDFSTFLQIFLSAHVKRCASITYTHGIYELP